MSGPFLMYPAIGTRQTCAGRINGIWYTWLRIDGRDTAKYPHSCEEDAMFVHDCNADILKLTLKLPGWRALIREEV